MADENDLPDEELLRMWEEGTPTTLLDRFEGNIPPIQTATNAAWTRTRKDSSHAR